VSACRDSSVVVPVHRRHPPGKIEQLHDSDITAFVKGYPSALGDEEDRNLTVDAIEVREGANDSGEVRHHMTLSRSAFEE
jgi:hypothetical protein